MFKKIPSEALKALAVAFKKFDHRNSDQRRAMAEKLVEFVVTDVYTQDLVTLLADEQTFNPGEILQFHTFRPVKAYVLDPGSTGSRTRIIKDSIALPFERVYVGTELDLDELRSGRYGTLNDYRRLVAEALLGQRNKQMWETLNNSITSAVNDGNFATFASGASTATKKAALDTAIDYVHDNTNSGPLAVVGRFTALNWIYQIADQSNISTFGDMTKEEIQARGFLTVYRGTPVFYLRDYKNADGVSVIGNSDIQILSDGSLKFARKSPGLESFDEIRGANYSWAIDFWTEYGSLVVEPDRNYLHHIF